MKKISHTRDVFGLAGADSISMKSGYQVVLRYIGAWLRFLISHGKPDMHIVWLRTHQWDLSRALRRLLSGQHPHPPGRWPTSKTGSYLMDQLLWHDSPLTVLRGLAKYPLARLQDRLLP